MLFTAAISSYALTTTHSLNFGSSGSILAGEYLAYGNAIFDTGYRFAISPKDIGFYTGADITFGMPMAAILSTDSGLLAERIFRVYYDPPQNFFSSIKVPFGYRWQESFIKGMGFYLGGGPLAQFVTTENNLTSAFGLFIELGFQTNKTSDTGFHLGLQSGISPLVYSNWDYLSDTWFFETTLQLGMSWRRQNKKD